MPVNLFDLSSKKTFSQSFNKLNIYNSNFISKNNKHLLLVINCKDLYNEDQKQNVLSLIEENFHMLKVQI